MARVEIVIDISAQDRFSSAFARIGAGMASLTTRLEEARQATAPLAEGLRRVTETAEALGFVVEGVGRQLGSDLPADLEQTNIVLRLQNDEVRRGIEAWADLELAAERAAASMKEAGDDPLFSPAAIEAAKDFGRRVAGQVTVLGGAVAGLQAGEPMAALIGGLADLVLSNEFVQETLAELNAGIQEVLTPILRDVLGPSIEAMRPALEQLSAAMIELQPVFEAPASVPVDGQAGHVFVVFRFVVAVAGLKRRERGGIKIGATVHVPQHRRGGPQIPCEPSGEQKTALFESILFAAAVTGTVAIALRLMGRTDGIQDAEAQARSLWENRAESPLDIKDKALEDDIPEPV